MSRTVVVSVTQEDIAAGEPCEALSCPVAIAIRRATGLRTYVDEDTIALGERYRGGPFVVSLPPPPEVTRFVDRFDHRRPVSPFTFTLELP